MLLCLDVFQLNCAEPYDVSGVTLQHRVEGAFPELEMFKDIELSFSNGEKRTVSLSFQNTWPEN